LNVEGTQAAVEWQLSQVVGNPEAACGGFVVAAKSPWWQEEQLVGVPAYWPFLWQPVHGTFRCSPVRGKPVEL
jgi:hypothetical protein